MLREWEREHPGRIDRIFRAMGHVDASHLIDRNLFPFATLQPTGVADPGGDRAFDDDDRTPAGNRRDAVGIDIAAPAGARCRRRRKKVRHDEAVVRCSSRAPRWPAAPRSMRSTATCRASAAGRPAARRRPTRSSGCRRSRRIRSRRSCSKTRRGGPSKAPASSPAPRAPAPDVTIQLGARITELDPSPFDDPFWYGGSAVPPAVRLRPLRPAVLRARAGATATGAPPTTCPYYEREVAVLIRDKTSGEALYESRAVSEGTRRRWPTCCRRCSAPR